MARQEGLVARIGVDIGGTFTDVVLEKGLARHTAKVLTTPSDRATGVVAGVRAALEAAGESAPREIVHGSTTGTGGVSLWSIVEVGSYAIK